MDDYNQSKKNQNIISQLITTIRAYDSKTADIAIESNFYRKNAATLRTLQIHEVQLYILMLLLRMGISSYHPQDHMI